MSEAPFEIIIGPANVWVATVGTTFPELTAIPGAAWTSLGRTEGGVAVTFGQTIKEITVDQAMMPVKLIRTMASMKVEFQLAEITMEHLAKALGLTVVDTAPGAGTIGTRSLTLAFSGTITRYAMLVRGPSPYMDANADFRLPNVAQDGEIKLAYVKDDKSVAPTSWNVMEDPDNAGEFGTFIVQDAAAA